MDTVHSWAVGLCAAAVIGAVVTALIPSGSLEKSVKTVVSVFLICAMILPFLKENLASQRYISINFDESDETQKALSAEVGRETEKYLKNSIEEILQKNGISCKDVVIEIEVKDESVSVSKVTVKAPSAEGEKVKKIIKQELGVEASIES
ncbi:MAG: stage III sporulation protein AF [Clostridia bacterium]|nr:stage III sporulation protein AF [Clostridia bacterium]